MPSFEIQADIFTRLSVFDSPKGSSNTFKTRKKYQPVFQKEVPNNLQLLKSCGADSCMSLRDDKSKLQLQVLKLDIKCY